MPNPPPSANLEGTAPSRAGDGCLPVVSILVPCRNEQAFIENCLESIVTNGYPLERLEVLVLDGESADRTAELVASYAKRYQCIRLIHNQRRNTVAAFNLGVARSRGEWVMLMSGHATYAPGAIERSIEHARRTGAENVGGIWRMHPRTPGILGEVIVEVLSHPFGVGGALYRTGTKEPRWADTAAYGCYRRSVFDQIGLFNEALTHSQDMEFNLRLKAAGGRTLLAPDIEIHYSTRTDFRSFIQHNFRNGLWVILPFEYSRIMPVALRHLVPLLFVSGLTCLVAAGFAQARAWALLGVCLGAYVLFAAAAGAGRALMRRRPLLALAMPPVFLLLHLTYGIGSLVGLIRLIGRSDLCKRAFDLAIASASLAVLSPILAAVALLVKVDSRGPVFYRGKRVGRGGRLFRIFKFRTMVERAEALGGASTAVDDPRITRVGAFLRKHKLDELPQLLNVVAGDMSLVGPRPQVAFDVAKYTEDERILLELRPGITDFASIRFFNEGELLHGHADPDQAYIELIRPEKLRLCLEYARRRSIWTDVRILWLTALQLAGVEVALP